MMWGDEPPQPGPSDEYALIVFILIIAALLLFIRYGA